MSVSPGCFTAGGLFKAKTNQQILLIKQSKEAKECNNMTGILSRDSMCARWHEQDKHLHQIKHFTQWKAAASQQETAINHVVSHPIRRHNGKSLSAPSSCVPISVFISVTQSRPTEQHLPLEFQKPGASTHLHACRHTHSYTHACSKNLTLPKMAHSIPFYPQEFHKMLWTFAF